VKRSGPIRRSGGLNPISAKRRAELNIRSRVRKEVLERDQYKCVAMHLVPDINCWGPLDVDEIVGRGRGGDWLDPYNCQVLCRAHHDWKHLHPAEATHLGLTRNRMWDP
jgi:hypothetical protein